MNTTKRLPDTQENPVFKELVSILGNGFILSLFTIDFFCFEYLLPILGSLIMLFGCHLAKEHDIHFKRTYQFALIRLVTMLFNFMIDWTKFHDSIMITYLQIGISAFLIIGMFYHMNQAFKGLYEQAGQGADYNNRLLKYIFLYLCTIFSTYLTVHLGILGAMLSLFILILNIIYLLLTFNQLGNQLSLFRTELTLSHYTAEEKKHVAMLLGAYGILLCLTVIASNKDVFLPISSSNQLTSSKSQETEIEKHLLDLGLDKDILADLPESELSKLETASLISSDSSVKEVNSGSLKITIYDITCKRVHRVLVYYEWLIPPDSRLYQIIECQYPKGSVASQITSKGYVLKEKDRGTLELPNINIGVNAASYPYVQHKLSNAGTHLRGYLAFSYKPSAKEASQGTAYTINYYYQASVFNLPYLNIIDYMNDYKDHTTSMVFDRVSLRFTL